MSAAALFEADDPWPSISVSLGSLGSYERLMVPECPSCPGLGGRAEQKASVCLGVRGNFPSPEERRSRCRSQVSERGRLGSVSTISLFLKRLKVSVEVTVLQRSEASERYRWS